MAAWKISGVLTLLCCAALRATSVAAVPASQNLAVSDKDTRGTVLPSSDRLAVDGQVECNDRAAGHAHLYQVRLNHCKMVVLFFGRL